MQWVALFIDFHLAVWGFWWLHPYGARARWVFDYLNDSDRLSVLFADIGDQQLHLDDLLDFSFVNEVHIW